MEKVIFVAVALAVMGTVGSANAQSNVITLGGSQEALRGEGDDAQAVLTATGAMTHINTEPWRAAVDLAASKAKTASVVITGSIYGGLGIGLGRKTRANTGNSNRISMGGPSSFMLSGLEDMGGGNQVFFKLEQGFSAKTGAQENPASFFNKQAYVAIRGPWGTLQGGNLYTPYFSTQALVADPSGSYALLSSSNIMETTSARLPNGIIYTLPGSTDVFTIRRTPGFAAAIAHYFGENAAGASKGSSNGGKVGWLSGDSKFRIEAAIHKQNTYTAGTADSDKTSWLVGAFYDFKFGRVHLAYAASKRKNNLPTGPATMENFHEAMTGVNMPLGPGRLLVTAIRKMYKDSDPRGLKDRWQFGANYDYPLSKRTKLMFGAVLNTNSGSTVEYAANTNSYAGAPASAGRPAAITIGINHIF